jgi:hypothetical protein
LNKSVRDAARQVAGLALLGTTGTALLTPDLQVDARNLVVYGNVDGVGSPLLPALSVGQVVVSVSDAVNNLVTVQANYAYNPIVSPVLQTFGMGTGPGPSLAITLRASVTMRAL